MIDTPVAYLASTRHYLESRFNQTPGSPVVTSFALLFFLEKKCFFFLLFEFFFLLCDGTKWPRWWWRNRAHNFFSGLNRASPPGMCRLLGLMMIVIGIAWAPLGCPSIRGEIIVKRDWKRLGTKGRSLQHARARHIPPPSPNDWFWMQPLNLAALVPLGGPPSTQLDH